MEPEKMYKKLYGLIEGAMKGRTMYLIAYSMGVVGSAFAKYGIELTDSTYVVLNMAIMAHTGNAVLEAIGDSDNFVKGIHTQGTLDTEQRYIAQFPEDNTIISVNSNYGGNVLQGKKCFALRIASCLGREEGWMAEHMLILGIENPQGETRYICGAFPSACGKTNLAMLIPPEGYRERGWKVWCVGDDIAWMHIGQDGRLWAVNPESGFFGVAPGTNAKSNLNALQCTHSGTIFTNTALDISDNTVWWEGLTKTAPVSLLDWCGKPWTPEIGVAAAHPNARFTSPIKNCPCLSPAYGNPQCVTISAIIFGGRRAKTAPLVYQSRNWAHGVFVGSIMASETTAAATGAVGVVRRDPMAMLPFCGYHMADYWQHWLDMGEMLKEPPKIFNVNWFQTDDEGRFLWPGFGDNLRVLEWVLGRCAQTLKAEDSALGYLPYMSDINLEGLDVDKKTLERLLEVDRTLWQKEVADIREFYERFGDKVPKALLASLSSLEDKLR